MGVFAKTHTAVGSVFPNLTFPMQPFGPVPGEPGVRFVTMRLYQPVGPRRMQMYSWCLVPKNASAEYKNAAYRAPAKKNPGRPLRAVVGDATSPPVPAQARARAVDAAGRLDHLTCCVGVFDTTPRCAPCRCRH
ncbi:hypothetical protein [Embleya hyalina]|uniref:Uncharacterized protein n=1 Tax=Embleya hyalina TaxID=516124 RepID=A0A401Z1N7_9ACTN|nr:hypothetical protein [Embleya hyalina]GCE00691.1 hypothetical protein EHYA_08417 [Embleya hyalina]